MTVPTVFSVQHSGELFRITARIRSQDDVNGPWCRAPGIAMLVLHRTVYVAIDGLDVGLFDDASIREVDVFALRPANMRNLRMLELLVAGDALDVGEAGELVTHDDHEGAEPPTAGCWRLREFVDGKDYCDAAGEKWIWSVGRRERDGAVFASTSAKFYEAPGFECLFLR